MKWFGYLHVNGSVKTKRFFSQQDIEEARESPFVERVTEVFDADWREAAERISYRKLKDTVDGLAARREKIKYEEGRRDGFNNSVDEDRKADDPIYADGVLKGILEKLEGEQQ